MAILKKNYVLLFVLRIYSKLKYCYRYITINKEVDYWRNKKKVIVQNCNSVVLYDISELQIREDQMSAIRREIKKNDEAKIGIVDQDGYILPRYDIIGGLPIITEKSFVKRIKYDISLIVTKDEKLAIRKRHTNKVLFINELRALYMLSLRRSNIPYILDVDFDKLEITCAYIVGTLLREILARKGAKIRDRDFINNKKLANLSQKERYLYRISEVKKYLFESIDIKTINIIYNELVKINNLRLIYKDIKPGNIIIDKKSGKPYWIDFEFCDYFPELPDYLFRILIKNQMGDFQLYFGEIRNIQQ